MMYFKEDGLRLKQRARSLANALILDKCYWRGKRTCTGVTLRRWVCCREPEVNQDRANRSVAASKLPRDAGWLQDLRADSVPTNAHTHSECYTLRLVNPACTNDVILWFTPRGYLYALNLQILQKAPALHCHGGRRSEQDDHIRERAD